jgi:hypothetical protein
MTAGDLAYLSALTAPSPDRRAALLAEAADRYTHARARYQYLDLRYYVPAEAKDKLLPPDLLTGNGLERLIVDPRRWPPCTPK